mmetsp:Transcript_34186/g.107783  ORF Transcript_34186/g.107783 Transcript_34186/m.107783 type:complete len:187 (+) Transcript_34186:273-833(+)
MLGTEEEEVMARGIEKLLTDLADCNERMSQVVTSGSRAASAALLKRYREILFDYKSEFRKLSSTIAKKKERADLLSGGGRGGGIGAGGDGGDGVGMRHLYAEQNSINSSMHTAGQTLDQASGARDSLRRQREMLSGAGGTLQDLASQFPAVNQIIESIRRRRTRENVVMGLAISSCVCFTIWYLVL